jgi:hypothetical protein
MKEQFDNENIYCRKLGHYLQFGYCRQEKNNLPCSKIFDCWYQRISVQEFLTENYNYEEVSYLAAPPEPKISSLLSLIERAQNLEK